MNPTDAEATKLAGAFFDDVLVPLAAEKREADMKPYFPVARDASATSYFFEASVSRMTAADFNFPGGGRSAGLIDAVVTHWLAEGESVLAASGERLRAINAELAANAAEDDDSVDVFCYTLF